MASMTAKNAAKFEAAFRKFASKVEAFGVKVDIDNVTRDGVQMKFGVVITAKTKDGSVEKPVAEREFEAQAPHFGIDPAILGQTINGSRLSFAVTGMRSAARANKNVLSIRRAGDGKVFVTSWYFLQNQLLSDPKMRKFVDEKTKIAPPVRRRRRSFADMF